MRKTQNPLQDVALGSLYVYLITTQSAVGVKNNVETRSDEVSTLVRSGNAELNSVDVYYKIYERVQQN